MFSFFKSSHKKSPVNSPITTPTDPRKSHDNIQSQSDDFEVVNPGNPQGGNIYPNFNHFGNPQQPKPAQNPAHPFQRSFSVHQIPYYQGVPFKLSAGLSSNSTGDSFEYKLKEIQQQIEQSLKYPTDYAFSLERSIAQE
ncbi:unnamed protein product [Diamesa serratosioi]